MEFFWHWCPAASASLNSWIHLVNQTAYMYHWSATTEISSIFQLLQLFFLCSNCSPIVPIVLPFRIVWLIKVIDHQYASILSCIGSQLSCMLFSFVVLGRCLLERGSANALGSNILSSILESFSFICSDMIVFLSPINFPLFCNITKECGV